MKGECLELVANYCRSVPAPFTGPELSVPAPYPGLEFPLWNLCTSTSLQSFLLPLKSSVLEPLFSLSSWSGWPHLISWPRYLHSSDCQMYMQSDEPCCLLTVISQHLKLQMTKVALLLVLPNLFLLSVGSTAPHTESFLSQPSATLPGSTLGSTSKCKTTQPFLSVAAKSHSDECHRGSLPHP